MNKVVERAKLLSIFADGKEHSCFEVINFGAVILRRTQRQVEKTFKNILLEYNWVRRCGKSGLFHTDWFQLTPKGDDAFRQMQISSFSKANDSAYRHYKYFNRDGTKGKMGVNLSTEDRITEKDMRNSGFIPKLGATKLPNQDD